MNRLPLILALVLWNVFPQTGHALEPFVHDLPLPSNVTTPAWLQIKPPDTDPTPAFAAWEFTITPPADTGDLAVTFYFTEVEGSFLRVYWQGAEKAETLCDNLYEGVAMPNQRTVVIPRSILNTGGKLVVQAGTSDAGLSRIEWNWVSTVQVAVTDPQIAPALLRTGNQALRQEEVSGEAPAAAVDRIKGSIISAIVQQEPARIEQGVEFVATLESLPESARIEVRLLGVPLDRNIAVWINDVPVNQLSLDVPDLSDPGYKKVADGENTKTIYIGWRKGTLLVPVSALHAGENRFRFAPIESEEPGTNPAPMALKDFVLQLNYETTTVAAPAAAPSATTSDPVTP